MIEVLRPPRAVPCAGFARGLLSMALVFRYGLDATNHKEIHRAAGGSPVLLLCTIG